MKYPVIVSDGSSAVDQYGSIYKAMEIENPEEITSIEIQLFDSESNLQAEILSIDAYVIWSQTTKSTSTSLADAFFIPITSTKNIYISTLVAEEFEFDLNTGIITISSNDTLSPILDSYIKEADRLAGDFTSVSNSKPKILFEIKIEKYRSVSDLRDLTSEQVNKIATAQAIEAAIFEYNYQFNLATQTQMGFHEIVYTAIVTAVSTALTIGVTAGMGSIVKSLVNPAKEVSSKMLGRLLGSVLGSASSFTASSVIYAVVKEIGQELLLDPWIEATVSGLVRRAGGNAMWQMILSSIAESGREALTGPLSSLFGSQQSEQSSAMSDLTTQYYEKGRNPTLQQFLAAINEDKANLRMQQDQRINNMRLLGGATSVLSFVSKAIGFVGAQFLGPAAALVYSTLKTYCFSEDISLKGVFSKAFNPIKVAVSKVGEIARNTKEFIVNNLGIGVGFATFGTMTVFLTLSLGPLGFLGGLGISGLSM